MSQNNVERVIGALATDEALRRQFAENPSAAIELFAERGIELTPCERHALANLDPRRLDRFANAIDARLQKSDMKRGTS